MGEKKRASAFYTNSDDDLSFHYISRVDAQPCIDLNEDIWTSEAFGGTVIDDPWLLFLH